MNALPISGILLLSAASLLSGADRVIQFNRDVRPILSDKCYSCHGPDAVAKGIPRRLDSEASAKAERAGKRAIVDGDPDASPLIHRITSKDPNIRMPAASSGLKLNNQEIETLRTWITQGAKWEKHWSLIPPARPELPVVRTTAWPGNPIDFFVLERLEREDLRPSPEASRETLLRRVTLDLTGLPPSPGEMDAFLRDKSDGAYERVVDRLLESPRYGERMAARWLDAARYADTNGYQYDGERVMWRWRDWVIGSFNRNQPFDQFALEQIAGDLLPNATLEQKIATGFNRNHRANTEDGLIPEEYAVEYVVDRVETTSTVFLGLTLGCARCHNHKYDPLTQKEFYQVFAYFNNIPERGRAMKYGNSPPVVAAPTAEQQLQLEAIEKRIAAEQAALVGQTDSLPRGAWEQSLSKSPPLHWVPSARLTAAFSFEKENGWKAVGGAASLQPGRFGSAVSLDGKTYIDAGNIAGFDIEDRFSLSAWVHSDSVPNGSVVTKMADNAKGRGYGLHLNKGKVSAQLTTDWTTDAIRLESEETLQAKRWYHLMLTYDGSRMAEGVNVYIDGKPAKVKVEQDNLYRPFKNAGKAFKDPLRIGGGAGPDKRFQGLMDEVRIYGRILSQAEIAILAEGQSLNTLAQKPETQRSASETLQLNSYFFEQVAAQNVRDTWQRLVALRLEKEKLERAFPTVMVMAENPARRDTFLLMRGAYDKPGEKVEPGTPATLPPLPSGAPNNRLGFAKWMIDRANPLTARVAVNRFWQMLFGAGIVKTSEDFGSQGDWPSHPALLDWLADEFMRSGWNVKALNKLIVTSATYRQSSTPTAELLQSDPENRLLARGPRLRLPAEMIRDQALLAAGLLEEKIGGPSVKPYMPEGIWKDLIMQDAEYNQSKGADLYRRSIYTFWKRTVAPPLMMNFDSALRESCVVRENRTNTPLQALNMMNDVTFVEAARFIGQRMLKEGGSQAADRLSYGFRLLTGRIPTHDEAEILRRNLQYHLDYFSGKPEQVKRYLGLGEAPVDPTLNQRELAAYASVASLILNLDESITKE